MKQIAISILIALLLICAAGTQAQVPDKPVHLYLGGGLTVPTGTFNDAQNPGFNGYGRVGFDFPGVLSLIAGADFHQLPFDDGGVSGFDGGDARLILISGGVKYNIELPASPVKPAMALESGLALYSISDLTLPTDEIQEFENQ